MDVGTGIALGTLAVSMAAVPVAHILTKNGQQPKNGNSPMTKELCEAKHKTLDFKIDLILKHFQIEPKEQG